MAAATPAEKQNWPAANYEYPENRHGLVIGLTAPTLCLAVLCE